MPPSDAEATPQPAAAGSAWPHPAVLALAVVAGALCAAVYGVEPRAFVAAFTAAVLVVLAATDLRDRLIPNRIVIPAACIVLVAQLAFYSDRAAEWILSALGASLFLFVPTLVQRGAIGMGDVKLALLLGAALGYAVLPALTLGFVALLPVSVYMLVREGAAARKKYLPLGPFLAFGAIVVLLLGGAS